MSAIAKSEMGRLTKLAMKGAVSNSHRLLL